MIVMRAIIVIHLAVEEIKGVKMKGLLANGFTILLFIFLLSDVAMPAIHIKYNSTDNVYLDAGSNDSLAIGDHLAIKKADTVLAEIEVVFVAEHSASCKIIKANGPLEIGELATVIGKTSSQIPEAPKPMQEASAKTLLPPQGARVGVLKPATTRLIGSISMAAYYWNDTGPSNLDFTQPSTRLNLIANKLWGTDFSFTLRSTMYYDQRTRRYSSLVPQSQWLNRIYQLSFAYTNDVSPLSFQIGRVISNRMSGIGYIDGLLIQDKVSKRILMGAFGGTEPQWQYSTFQTSLQKYGIFAGYTKGDYRSTRYEMTLAMAGEYHGSTASREFAYLQNNLNIGSAWNIFQSGELDFNRGWRKIKTGSSLTLSNLYISARRRINRWISAGLSYDSRKNYWTYEIRTLADSLFDDKLRQGARADLSLRLPREYFLNAGFGLQKRQTDSRPTYSYSLGVNKSNFIAKKFSVNFQGSGFTNPLTNGYNLQARLGRSIRKSDLLSVGYGTYIYIIQNSNIKRYNRALSLSGQVTLVSPLYFYGTYEYDTGDDTRGHRFMGELGYRF
jgi:hypothetical protein